ncbi:MAG: PhzF family phenazine biosynthesis protein [Acidimicrobiia bacterium]
MRIETRRRFRQVDVFGSGPISGNPLAVVVDADGLSTEDMLGLTRWMNLSESTFLLPPISPEADYRVRIFTLAGELPFAGHPTLGSCHSWLAAGGEPGRGDVIVQECGAGLIRIKRDGESLAFAAPPLEREGPIEEELLAEIVAVLDIDRTVVVDAAWVDNGPGWVGVLLDDAEAVLAIDPHDELVPDGASLDIGVVGPHSADSEFAFEVRAFFSDDHGNLREDPVTGSLNASLGQWLLGSERAAAPYLARQGTRLGRSGRILVDQDEEGTVWVGGATVTVVDGTIAL